MSRHWVRCPKCDNAFSFKRKTGEVRCPHCKKVVGMAEDGDKTVDKPLNLQLIASLKSHTSSITTLTMSHNGKFLASGSCDKTVILWDWDTREPQDIFSHETEILAVQFSFDSNMLVSKSNDGVVKIWDLESSTLVESIETDNTFEAIACSDQWLAVGKRERVDLYDMETFHLQQSLDGTPARSLAFSPDGKLLAKVGVHFREPIELWNVLTKKRRAPLPASESTEFIAFSPDGRTLLSAGEDVQVWDGVSGSRKGAFLPLGRTQYFTPAGVSAMAVSPDSVWLAVGQYLRGDNLQIWDFESQQSRAYVQADEVAVNAVTFSADNKMLITGGEHRAIKVWSIEETRE